MKGIKMSCGTPALGDAPTKPCTKCGLEKELSDFRPRPNTRHKYGVNSSCRECEKAYTSAWREKNPGAAAKYTKWYKKVNPHKANEHQAKRRAVYKYGVEAMPDEELEEVQYLYWLAKDLEVISGEKYHVDHIIPLSKGGEHRLHNLQILPAEVNLRKSDKIWHER